MQNSGAGRQVGVTVPRSQLSVGKGVANSLVHCVPAELYAIQYADDNGALQNEVVMISGGQAYSFPNGQQWASSLRPVPAWLKAKLLDKQEAQSNTVPTDDAVDVINRTVEDVIG